MNLTHAQAFGISRKKGSTLKTSHHRYETNSNVKSRLISSGSQFTVNDISYDPQGNIETLTRNAPTMANPEGTPVDQLSYNYTARTNRLASVADAVSTDLDWDAKPSTFQYNRVGSMTRMTETLAVSTVRRTDVVRYDERQLPEQMHLVTFDRNGRNDSLYVSYRYDVNGLRISKRIRESAHGSDLVYERYVRDGDRLVGVFDENNELKSWNLGGTAGLVGRADPNPWLLYPVRSYYVTDHLGSIRAVLNASGTVTEGRDYYPYGLTMPGRFYVQADTTREGFTGHELDKETGDYYAGARYYSPALARWFVVDPMAEAFPGWSSFNYTMGNPVMLVDPDGMCPLPPCAEFDAGLRRGMGQGFTNTISGFKDLLTTDPRVTARAAWDAVTVNRAETVETVRSAVTDRVNRFIHGNAGDRGEVLGEAGFIVAEIVVGTKGASGLNRAARSTRRAPASTRFVDNARVVDQRTSQVFEGTVDLGPTLDRIRSGGSFPHRNDGSVFRNSEGILPNQPAGYYREFVHPTPGIAGPGPQRIIQGQGGEIFYTPDHYRTFIPVNP